MNKINLLIFFITLLSINNSQAVLTCEKINPQVNTYELLIENIEEIAFDSCVQRVAKAISSEFSTSHPANIGLAKTACRGVKTMSEADARNKCVRHIGYIPSGESFTNRRYPHITSELKTKACKKIYNEDQIKYLSNCIYKIDNIDGTTPKMAFITCNGVNSQENFDSVIKCFTTLDNISYHQPKHVYRVCSEVRNNSDAKRAINCLKKPGTKLNKKAENCAFYTRKNILF